MLDGARASQEPQKEQQEKQRTPDLMDCDPLLENLKTLQEETKSDDDDELASESSGGEEEDPNQPGCSTAPPKKSRRKKKRGKKDQVRRRRHWFDPGRFLWIWLMGLRLPSLVIDGEPNLPIEIIDEVLSRKNKQDAIYFRELLRNKNIFIRMCTDHQFNAIKEKSEVCRQLKITTLSLMSRSDIERIMGELRGESAPTKAETDHWNKDERIHIVHVNFIDYNENWLSSDDLEEDPHEAGTHGYWYKSRVNMRCIECAQCEAKFTPPDFIMHHHFPIEDHGYTHIGCTSLLWSKYISVHQSEATEENLTEWRDFVLNSRRITQRAYDDAAPNPMEPMEVQPDWMEEIDKEAAIDVEGEEIQPCKRRMTLDPNDDVACCKKRKLHIADFLGPSGSKGLQPRDVPELKIAKALEQMDEKSLEMLFLKSPEEFYTWIKEMDFAKNVVVQQEEWAAKRKEPNYKHTGSASYSSGTGEFENMHGFELAPRAVKLEIQLLSDKLAKIHGLGAIDPWRAVKKEHELLRGISPEAMRVLNRPPAPPPFPRLPLQFSLPQLAQQAQLLMANGKQGLPVLQQFQNTQSLQILQNQLLQQHQKQQQKLFPTIPPQLLPLAPTPFIASTPVVKTPIVASPTVVTPTPPIVAPIPKLPFASISPADLELLKQQITLALANPALFPKFYPNLPVTAYDGLSKFFKETAAVQP